MQLEINERIERVIRKHPFYIILETIGLIALAALPDLLSILFDVISGLLSGMVQFDFKSFIDTPIGLQGFLYNLWLLTLWFLFVYRFTDYYLDKWVITNKRVIDIEQRGFFIREVSSVRYPKIQDATIEITGLIPTLLNFGTIKIQTAGTEPEFVLTTAPKPLANKEFIIDLKLKSN